MANTNRNKELWKDIPGWEGFYQVSSLGRVKSLLRRVKCYGGYRTVPEKIRKQSVWNGRHLAVKLKRTGRSRVYYTHQLVAMAFLGHNTSGHKVVVDHINEDPQDNRVENLQLTSVRENTSKSMRHKGNKTSRYTGVSWSKKEGYWRSQAVLNGQKHHLGFFNCETAAMLKYNSFIQNGQYEQEKRA